VNDAGGVLHGGAQGFNVLLTQRRPLFGEPALELPATHSALTIEVILFKHLPQPVGIAQKARG
jgi:hypothetical protein